MDRWVWRWATLLEWGARHAGSRKRAVVWKILVARRSACSHSHHDVCRQRFVRHTTSRTSINSCTCVTSTEPPPRGKPATNCRATNRRTAIAATEPWTTDHMHSRHLLSRASAATSFGDARQRRLSRLSLQTFKPQRITCVSRSGCGSRANEKCRDARCACTRGNETKNHTCHWVFCRHSCRPPEGFRRHDLVSRGGQEDCLWMFHRRWQQLRSAS